MIVRATKKKRPGNFTFSCPIPLQEFARDRAGKLNLRGGASELLRRLLKAEKISKRGIAEHQADYNES